MLSGCFTLIEVGSALRAEMAYLKRLVVLTKKINSVDIDSSNSSYIVAQLGRVYIQGSLFVQMGHCAESYTNNDVGGCFFN